MTWQVDRVLVFIGRALDLDGEPIKFARFENAGAFAGTDDRGWFQVETGQVESLILKKKDGSSCQLALGEYDHNEDVHVFNDLLCVPIDDNDPDASATQAQASTQLN